MLEFKSQKKIMNYFIIIIKFFNLTMKIEIH